MLDTRFTLLLAVGMSISLVAAAGVLTLSGVSLFGPQQHDRSFRIVVTPSSVSAGQSVTLTVSASGTLKSATIHLSISVQGPSGSGILTFDYLSLETDRSGNGQVSVPYLFPAGCQCSGQSSTTAPGTYTVAAEFAVAYLLDGTATTSFTVIATP
jgi:hypothetical protein